MISAEEFCTYALDHAPAPQLPSSICQLGRFELSLGPLMLQKMEVSGSGMPVRRNSKLLAWYPCFRFLFPGKSTRSGVACMCGGEKT